MYLISVLNLIGVIVFSDDAHSLNRIRGDLIFEPESDVASQLETIARHSETLLMLGVYTELHLNSGYSGGPGNAVTDRMAKMAMYDLHMRMKTSWLTIGSVTDIATQPAPSIPGRARILPPTVI